LLTNSASSFAAVHRWAIIRVSLLVIFLTSFAVRMFSPYWKDMLEVAKEDLENYVGQTVAVLVGTAFLPWLWRVLWTWRFNLKWKDLLGLPLAAFAVVVWYSIFIGPARIHDSLTREIASLNETETESDPVLKRQLQEVASSRDQETKRADEADKRAKENYAMWIASLTATNAPTSIAALDDAIEIVKRMQSENPMATNSRLRFQYELDLKSLNDKKAIETRRQSISEIYGFWHYAYRGFTNAIVPHAAVCGAQFATNEFPSADTLSLGIKSSQMLFVDGDCKWKAEMEFDFQRGPDSFLILSVRPNYSYLLLGIQRGECRAEFGTSSDGIRLSKAVPMNEATNIIAVIDDYLGMLIESQRSAFMPPP